LCSVGRRRIVYAAVTDHFSAGWAAQSIVEGAGDALEPPRFLIHDRDSIYGADFRHRVRGLGTRLLATPPRAPTGNAFAERVIGTLRRDCFDLWWRKTRRRESWGLEGTSQATAKPATILR